MKIFFKAIASINKLVLPSMKQKDLMKLSKRDKMLVGFRYYITKKSLE